MKKTKIISIEATVLSEEKATGVGRAVKGYIASLLKKAPDNQYHIFMVHPTERFSLTQNNLEIHYFSDILPGFFQKTKYYKFLYRIKFLYVWFIIPILAAKIRSHFFIGTHGLLFPMFLKNKIKSFYIIYDFVYILFPGTMTKKNQMLIRHLIKRNIKKADEIITISESVTSELKQYIDNTKVCHTIYPGYDDSLFFPVKLESRLSEDTQKKYNITRPYILSVATIEPRKNLEKVCTAFERFNTDHKYQLVLVGKIGWNTSSFLQSIKISKYPDDVIITGFVDDIDLSPLYSNAELFIFISLYEGFGLPVLEAMACGCPVLISDIPPLIEIASNSAITVNPYDIDQITESLYKITMGKKTADTIKKKSLKRVEKFTWDKSGEKLKKIITGD